MEDSSPGSNLLPLFLGKELGHESGLLVELGYVSVHWDTADFNGGVLVVGCDMVEGWDVVG